MTDAIQQARKLLREEAGRLSKVLNNDRTRSRAPLVRRLHEVRQMLSPAYAFSSQAGQDAIVDQIMAGKRGGTFVDVGGYDGVTGSNTYFFETHRGWSGTLVEPVPKQLEKAKAARSCDCLGVAVGSVEGEADFIEISEGFTQMSGLAETYDAKLLDTVRADKRHKENVVRVRTRTLSAILHDAGLKDPDFVSLDIEGGELACLTTFPFSDHDIKIWSIENNTGGSEIKKIMNAEGYELVEFCGPDEVYARPTK